MTIVLLLIGIAFVAFGALLVVKVKVDISNGVCKKSDRTERSEEVGTTMASMGAILTLASIVKLTGAIGTFAFVVILILDIACMVGLLYLINKKYTA